MKPAAVENGTAAPGHLIGVTRKLDLLLAITLCGFVFSVAYYFYRGVYLGQNWPYNSPFYDPTDHFNDFYNQVLFGRDMQTVAHESNYMPVANVYARLFDFQSRSMSYALFLIAPVLCLAWCTVRSMNGLPALRKLTYVIGIFFISYPFLTAVDRGNFDLHIFVYVALFIFFYQQPSSWAKGLAAFCLAVAIAFKAYPVLFAVLYFKERRYRELALAGTLTVAITLLAAVPEGGIVKALCGFFGNVGEASIIDVRLTGRFNLSLFNAGRLVWKALEMPAALRWFTAAYTPFSIALLVLVCGQAARRSLPLWRSATALACAMCFIPKISYDYRLLMLIVPLCLFIGANTPMTRWNTIVCVVFGLLLIPKGQIILYFKPNLGPWGHGVVTPASLINPLLLLALTTLVLFPSKKEEPAPLELLPAGVEPEMVG